ncbi:MAG: hypothetical protein HY342_02920 [Candidatus Lambdaproteobacteria bacterium]|nr:hypothetical protein [Candidatus Lambdaproteobacteria bacterium]
MDGFKAAWRALGARTPVLKIKLIHMTTLRNGNVAEGFFLRSARRDVESQDG